MSLSLSRLRILLVLVIGVCLYLLFFHRLAARDLWNSHEARAGMNARSMIEEGHWLLPRLPDGRWETQKPPLYYWSVAGLARLSGDEVNAWHIRLPSTLSALGCLAILMWLGWMRGQVRVGLIAALVLATSLHFTWLARVGRIDMPLTFCVALALACFYVTSFVNPSSEARNSKQIQISKYEYQNGKLEACSTFCNLKSKIINLQLQLVAYLALAAAVLLKGPIGLALPAVVLIVYFICEGELTLHWQSWLRVAHRLGLWWGLPLVFVLTVPWFWIADQISGGEMMESFFWLHNFQRAFGGSHLRGHPWWRYVPQFLFDFLPWTPILLWLIWKWRVRWNPLAKLGASWLLSMMILLSISRYKRADYLMPLYPGAALLVAGLWSEQIKGASVKWLLSVLIVCSVGWLIRVELYLPEVESEREQASFARRIQERCPEGSILFFRTEMHALAFHLHRPLHIVVDWRKLDRWPCQEPTWIVMPQSVARDWPRHLRHRHLRPILRCPERGEQQHEKPIVVLRLSLNDQKNRQELTKTKNVARECLTDRVDPAHINRR